MKVHAHPIKHFHKLCGTIVPGSRNADWLLSSRVGKSILHTTSSTESALSGTYIEVIADSMSCIERSASEIFATRS